MLNYFDTELEIKKLSIDLVKVIIEEGNKWGLRTTAHVWKRNDVEELLHTELYGIEHGIIDQDIQADDTILSLWKEQGAYYIPTVNAGKL